MECKNLSEECLTATAFDHVSKAIKIKYTQDPTTQNLIRLLKRMYFRTPRAAYSLKSAPAKNTIQVYRGAGWVIEDIDDIKDQMISRATALLLLEPRALPEDTLLHVRLETRKLLDILSKSITC